MVPSVEDSYVYTAQPPFFLVPTGYKSRLHHVAGAHLRLEVRKLGQGKGQPASVPSLRVYFEALIMGPAPPAPHSVPAIKLAVPFPKETDAAQKVGAMAGRSIYPECGSCGVGCPRKEKGW